MLFLLRLRLLPLPPLLLLLLPVFMIGLPSVDSLVVPPIPAMTTNTNTNANTVIHIRNTRIAERTTRLFGIIQENDNRGKTKTASTSSSLSSTVQVVVSSNPKRSIPFPSKDESFLRLPSNTTSATTSSASTSTSTTNASATPPTIYDDEFHQKITYFTRYSQRDIALLRSNRLRIVMAGMAASPYEPDVYRAFQILYHDLGLPLRLAGRFIFKRLSIVLQQLQHQREEEIDYLWRIHNQQQSSLIDTTTTTTTTTTAFMPPDLTRSDLELAQYMFLLLIEIVEDACYTKRNGQQNQASNNYYDDSKNSRNWKQAGINSDHDRGEHEIILTLHMLQDSGLLDMLAHKMELTCEDTLANLAQAPDNDGDDDNYYSDSNSSSSSPITSTTASTTTTSTIEEWDFPSFVLGLQRCIQSSTIAKKNTITDLLQELLLEVSISMSTTTTISQPATATDTHYHAIFRIAPKTVFLDLQRQSYSNKFDSMLAAFAEWGQDRMPPPLPALDTTTTTTTIGDTRRKQRLLQVLRGCFIGAENEPVREALRIVYMDVPAMRVAGNTIFRLMSALISRNKRMTE